MQDILTAVYIVLFFLMIWGMAWTFYILVLFSFSFCFHVFNLNLKVIKDAIQGSEPGKTISLYVLDAVVCIDHERYFLSQLQSRGFLRSCLMNISNFSCQVCLSFLHKVAAELLKILYYIMFNNKKNDVEQVRKEIECRNL